MTFDVQIILYNPQVRNGVLVLQEHTFMVLGGECLGLTENKIVAYQRMKTCLN